LWKEGDLLRLFDLLEEDENDVPPGLYVRVMFAGPVLSHCSHSDEMSGWLELDRMEGEGTGDVEKVDMRR